jgi:hypothetical protein
VTVRRTSTTGTLVSGATISAIHAAGTGCTAGETLTTTTTTDTNGKIRLALPYGAWTIRAAITSPVRNGTATVTLDPVTTAVPALTVVVP